MSFLVGRRRPKDVQVAAETLHDDLVAAIRQPVFYLAGGVPDTFEGRFDLLVLHLALVLRRLGTLGNEGQDLAQHLVDTVFARLDIAMRELGVSDIAVPKRMKRLAEGFRGRTAVYDQALSAGDRPSLADAIARNLLNGRGDGGRLALYAVLADERMASMTLDMLRTGLRDLPDPTPVLLDQRADET